MKRLLMITCSFIIYTGYIMAQDSLRITGKLIDAETRLPLKNVSITLSNTLYGTISDSAGLFTIQATSKTTVLNFSILGYEKKTRSVKAGSVERLIIELAPKASQLSEISINASAIETVSKSKRYHVLDYDFYHDDILMITYVDLDKAKLVLITPGSDTLGYKKIPHEPNRLFKDCLGNLHVVCKDSIYQAFYNGNSLMLLPPKSIRDFETVLLPCVAQDSANYYVVEKHGSHLVEADVGAPFYSNPLALGYISIHKKKRSRQLFSLIADEKKIAMSQDEEAFEARKAQAGLNTTGDRVFAEKMIFTEIYAPLFKIRDSIYVFDYANGTIKSFDKALQLKREVPVSYHKSLRFQEEMQVDDVSWKVFALFETNGISELKEIDLNTGAVRRTLQIPFPFVNHIKVRGSFVYFIRKQRGDDNTRCLSRMRLD